jgi:pyruvate,water dikinase
MKEVCWFAEIGPNDTEEVGGKGLSLARLAGAGLPVPPGFCITTEVHRRLRGQKPQADPKLAARITEAYRRLGSGVVAVRSSATAEDGALTSFAGQQETVLGVEGEAALLDAVARCWASFDSERAVAYRRRQAVDDRNRAMAVVVQRLVPSEIAGVLFTRDPFDPEGRRLLIEASWGLGESVVSGRLIPDRYHLDRESGAVLDRQISVKSTRLTAAGLEEVSTEQQAQPCLDETCLAELAALGRRVEALYGDPRDIEWALAEGRLWLLQARPITTAGASEREQVRREEIAVLRAKARPGGTVWSRFNLAETLPEPTPMTWAVIQRLLSGRGGMGQMYRDLGFEPDAALDGEGVYDLVCGRPYCNLSREPGMYANGLPLCHSFAALKADPSKAVYPRARFDWSRAGWRFWMFLPLSFLRSLRLTARLGYQHATFVRRFRNQIVPAFAAEVAREASEDLMLLDSRTLLERLEYWTKRTLHDFARESLKPTVLAGVAIGIQERELVKLLGPERGKCALGRLAMGAAPDPEADLSAAVRKMAAGQLDRAAFLEAFGHRGSQEMELSQPRWAEDPVALDALLSVPQPPQLPSTEPLTVCEQIVREAHAKGEKREDLKQGLSEGLRLLHTWLSLRETGKHYLMKGYALIRRILVELDRRHNLGGGIFYLTPKELPRLAAGQDLSALIAERRQRRALALSLEVPQVLFSDDLDAIGRPVNIAGADTFQGIPLSAGVAEGPALVLHEPSNRDLPTEPYILVCPSTDPAWVPLFMNARGLIMETGGVLSHGAIVAREFVLPAVAGLPDIHRRVRSGQRLRVDGSTGTVSVLAEK